MAVVDTSDFQSYLAGNKTKDDIIALFNLENNDDTPDEIGTFYSRLELLVWIIGNHFNESNNDNKQFIFQLTLDYLIHYYNLIKDEVIQDEIGQHVNNALNSINVLIVRLYYRLKYYDLVTIQFDEFKNAVVCMEDRNEVITDNSISSGNLDDVISTSREEIHNMIRFLQEGNTQIVLQRLQFLVNNPIPTKTDEPSPREEIKETISVSQSIEIYNQRYKPYTSEETEKQNIENDDNEIDIDEISEEEAILNVMSNYYKIVPDEELKQSEPEDQLDITEEPEPEELEKESEKMDDTLAIVPVEEEAVANVEEVTVVTAEELANELFDSSWNINTITKIGDYIASLNALYEAYDDQEEIAQIISAQKIYIGYLLTFLKSQDMI